MQGPEQSHGREILEGQVRSLGGGALTLSSERG